LLYTPAFRKEPESLDSGKLSVPAAGGILRK
jgi:hypothetical protein